MVNSIKQALRLNMGVFARDKGKSSIQVAKLSDIFQNEVFRNVKKLTQTYPTIEYHKKQLDSCTIFTLMDVDDCEDLSVRNNYLKGQLSGLGNHELKPYIRPIYFKENFEDTLKDIKFRYVAKRNRDKHEYIKAFDPVEGLIADVPRITEMRDKCLKSETTNLDEFLTYCLDHQFKLGQLLVENRADWSLNGGKISSFCYQQICHIPHHSYRNQAISCTKNRASRYDSLAVSKRKKISCA